MVGKVIGFGPTRALAARRLTQGLQQLQVHGVGTNQAFLVDILQRPAFHDAPLTTLFMKEQFADGWTIAPELMRRAEAAAAWHVLFPACTPAAGTIWQQPSAFRNMRGAGRSGKALLHVSTDRSEDRQFTFVPEGDVMAVNFGDQATALLRFQRLASGAIRVIDADNETVFHIEQDRSALVLSTIGMRWQASVKPSIEVLAAGALAEEAGRGTTVSAMPGMITAVGVTVGQRVGKGDFLLEMEAMKLIHAMTAEVSGVVKAVHCKRGDTVSAGATLVEIEADESVQLENKEN